MDGLSKKIAQRNGVALNLVKTMLTNPMLINIDAAQGMPYAVPLECETYQQSGQAQVSEELVILADGKQNIADNVAPGAWSWELQGYVPGNKLLEPTNYFTPIVKMNTDILRSWFKKGAILFFRDGESQFHKRVVIQTLTTSQQKDCRNKCPFSMTIKEINVMEEEQTAVSKSVANATAAAGSVFGAASKAGAVICQVASVLL